jgi:hypothetical protein
MFLSVALFAISFGSLRFLLLWGSDDPRGASLVLWMWLFSGATFGYGVGVLFDRAFYGAVVGAGAGLIHLGVVWMLL